LSVPLFPQYRPFDHSVQCRLFATVGSRLPSAVRLFLFRFFLARLATVIKVCYDYISKTR
jgi:hypothetical protein